MDKPFIVALDFASKEEVRTFLQPFSHTSLFLKVGMELYFQEGPAIIDELKQKGHHIFLDLKLHDIPHTVKKAMKGLAKLGVDLVNVHASGGSAMMRAAIEGLEEGTPHGMSRPRCIAVTQLTSTSEQVLCNELLIDRPMKETVVHYASLAYRSGLDGVVCSAQEVPLLRASFGTSFITVTPGIRFAGDKTDDQVRVVTPYEAKQLGTNYIVIGRSITKASDPYAAYERLKREWDGGQ
ncbi:orotidine 5'-phosphate decarboxylase [Anoxybacillus gonensis]|uniref:Orotidine 5'-phosphate decarboxylase n=1 Tax=Anoxybacillus gonensis TaxID=198467 RepID=A0AAW7TIB6_9BACL|nr:orotidine-5'-phosphate decarboxylase [Anoxybacillus gonensis]GIW49620.1 MAG: orotidine 5'-phosphate decarboxylase [Anoxybacillus sp.]AKS37985.1 orotidine 5'-phosphate decarboxylase [Anoxybacillus gonensis]EMI11783.1 orotidine 5'-phosphate decarboxylase [Anoxybacillus gonensis]KGP60949.1 orotidine 5'-phosphate decarboxylase [Anoxybacillus gonensis]MDO0877346.1 orotidine-5'-phosphate decarboxylase [Anoxybacillus gonensis]